MDKIRVELVKKESVKVGIRQRREWREEGRETYVRHGEKDEGREMKEKEVE